MIKTIEFSAFGRQYRTTQFAAIPAMAVMGNAASTPDVVLSRTEVNFKGSWINLGSPQAINNYVNDATGILAPRLVLNGIIDLVAGYSFNFVRSWKSAKVPRRFVDGANSIESKHIDPMIGTLVVERLATMRELEEYYSMEDAFRMFDALIVKGINQALSHEAAMADAKNKRH